MHPIERLKDNEGFFEKTTHPIKRLIAVLLELPEARLNYTEIHQRPFTLEEVYDLHLLQSRDSQLYLNYLNTHLSAIGIRLASLSDLPSLTSEQEQQIEALILSKQNATTI